jgi:predicted O-linked N-acetylglucosamine transferase (SPINDLY family)
LTLGAIRERLARNRDACALFDTARFTRNLEGAYTRMWERYRLGQRPEIFAVGESAS